MVIIGHRFSEFTFIFEEKKDNKTEKIRKEKIGFLRAPSMPIRKYSGQSVPFTRLLAVHSLFSLYLYICFVFGLLLNILQVIHICSPFMLQIIFLF